MNHAKRKEKCRRIEGGKKEEGTEEEKLAEPGDARVRLRKYWDIRASDPKWSKVTTTFAKWLQH